MKKNDERGLLAPEAAILASPASPPSTPTRWCILRTAGPRTVALARSLSDGGIQAWTPTFTVRQRATRRGIARDRTSPFIPTFVFAPAERLLDLCGIADDPRSQHPPFSVFRHDGRVPLIGEASLAQLRQAEQDAAARYQAEQDERDRETTRRIRAETMRTEKARKKALRKEHRSFTVGTQVNVTDMPALTGMQGVVTESRGATAVIHFGGNLTIEIEAWRLAPHDIHVRAA